VLACHAKPDHYSGPFSHKAPIPGWVWSVKQFSPEEIWDDLVFLTFSSIGNSMNKVLNSFVGKSNAVQVIPVMAKFSNSLSVVFGG
jgi:hypothetical protein